ncbi:uncharacterized protein [Ptychodera flava]|uniref:uncharacterized protein n=1 Tax=Ptychodera flava TaxID=63121 RepID=UPI003969F89B
MAKSQDYSSMTVPQLKERLRETGYSVTGKKDELVKRLKLSGLTVPELKDQLREKKLSMQGRKEDLVKRLQNGSDGGTGKKKAIRRKDPFSNVGVKCTRCRQVMSSKQELEHVNGCWFEEGDANVMLLQVKSYYCNEAYRLLLAFNIDATFKALDSVLRQVWMECCGHMSHFLINKELEQESSQSETSAEADAGNKPSANGQDWRAAILGMMSPHKEIRITSAYSSGFDLVEEEKPMTERMMKYCEGYSILYEYDMGTTTEVTVKYLGKKHLQAVGSLLFVNNILMQNVKPEVPCKKCGKLAKWIAGDYDSEYYCTKRCGETSGVETCMLLPYVNSPRSGSCGYTGRPLWM